MYELVLRYGSDKSRPPIICNDMATLLRHMLNYVEDCDVLGSEIAVYRVRKAILGGVERWQITSMACLANGWTVAAIPATLSSI